VEENTEEGDEKVTDDLERNEEEGSRSCGVAGYCQRHMSLEQLKAKTKKKKTALRAGCVQGCQSGLKN